MAKFNPTRHQVTCKVAYFGAPGSGKTSNLQWLERLIPSTLRGEIERLATDADTPAVETLSFDLDRVLSGLHVTFQLFALSDDPAAESWQRSVLADADGVVWVAEAAPERAEANVRALERLEQALRLAGRDPEQVPVVLQWNRRAGDPDCPGRLFLRFLGRRPWIAADLARGRAVLPTLKLLAERILVEVHAESERRQQREEAARLERIRRQRTRRRARQPRPAAGLVLPRVVVATQQQAPRRRRVRPWQALAAAVLAGVGAWFAGAKAEVKRPVGHTAAAATAAARPAEQPLARWTRAAAQEQPLVARALDPQAIFRQLGMVADSTSK